MERTNHPACEKWTVKNSKWRHLINDVLEEASQCYREQGKQCGWKGELRVGAGFEQCLCLLSPSMCHFEKSKGSVYSQCSHLVHFHCITCYYAHIAELLKQVTQFKLWTWKWKVDTEGCLLWLLELKKKFRVIFAFFTFFLIRKMKHLSANAKESILKFKSFLINDGRDYLNYYCISPAIQCCLY